MPSVLSTATIFYDGFVVYIFGILLDNMRVIIIKAYKYRWIEKIVFIIIFASITSL